MKNSRLTTPNSQLTTKTAIILALTIACLILPQAAQAAAPVADVQALTIDEDTPVDITLTATDADGDTLAYYVVAKPTHGSLSNLESVTNRVLVMPIRYTPTLNYNGADSLTFKANDGTSDSAVVEVSITINPVDDPPALAFGNITFGVEDSTLVEKTYKLATVEVDGDSLTYTASGLPFGATLDPSTGELKWTVSTTEIGTYGPYTFTVTDNTSAHLFHSKTASIIIRQAVTYYVDQASGLDTNPGTSDAPWQTIPHTWSAARAGNVVAEGDTVLFRNGSYGQFKEDSHDGIAKHFHRTDWITYKADVGCVPDLTSIAIFNFHPGTAGHGESYLRFEGFNISGIDGAIYSTVDIEYVSCFLIKNCHVMIYPQPYDGSFAPYIWPGLAGVNGRAVNHFSVEDCEIHNVNRGIVTTSNSTNIIIRNNTIYDVGEDGIITIGDGVLVENNYIHNLDYRKVPINFQGTISGTFALGDVVEMACTDGKPNAKGIVAQVTNGNILAIWQTSDEFFYSPIQAVNAEHRRGDTITGPTGTLTSITWIDAVHQDGITIGTGGQNYTVTGNKIIRNLPGDIALIGGSQGLKLDAPKHITISNNLIVTVGLSPGLNVGILSGGGLEDCNIINNTITGTLKLHNLGPATMQDVNNMHNNIIGYLSQVADGVCKPHIINHGNNIIGSFTSSGGPAYPFVANSTELTNYNINNLFVDAANNDFRLKESSTAINFGNPDYGPATDILGNSRVRAPDAGCYESPYEERVIVNNPPVLNNIGDKTANEGSSFTFNILASDPDSDQTVTVTASGLPDGATFNGFLFSWIPNYAQSGTYNVTFTATDDGSPVLTDSEIMTITVNDITADQIGVVLRLSFDNNILDSSVNNHATSLVSLGEYPKFAIAGMRNQAIEFDGSGSINTGPYVNVPSASDLGGMANLTLSFWAKKNTTSVGGYIMHKHVTYCVSLGSNTINGYLFTGADGAGGAHLDFSATTNAIADTNWHHYAITYDGSSVKIYVDGSSVWTGSLTGNISMNPSRDIVIGKYPWGVSFNGVIDDLRIYDTALSETEIANIFNPPAGIPGDINSDGSVDAIDLQLLINMILSGSFDSKADLNKDSSVDAMDLQALVNIILGA